MAERFDFTGDELAAAYSAAVDAIEAGGLVVFPTDTVYGIAADAFKAEAVQRLLDAKGRGREMPPPVLISAVETMDALATSIPESGRRLCEEFWPGALTVICYAQTSLMWDLGETKGTVALRVPDHENTRELLSRTGPLAVSSANLSGKPAATDVYEAEQQLTDTVTVYLDGGTVSGGEPSTIVDLTGEFPQIVREGAISVDRLREIVPEVSWPEVDEKGPIEADASQGDGSGSDEGRGAVAPRGESSPTDSGAGGSVEVDASQGGGSDEGGGAVAPGDESSPTDSGAEGSVEVDVSEGDGSDGGRATVAPRGESSPTYSDADSDASQGGGAEGGGVGVAGSEVGVDVGQGDGADEHQGDGGEGRVGGGGAQQRDESGS